jgi:hypothetical protein
MMYQTLVSMEQTRMNDRTLTTSEVKKIMGLSSARLRFWTDGKVLSIRPSVRSATQGATALFSIGDFYMLSLAQAAAIGKQANFGAIGLAIDAISSSNEWELWEQNRGQIFAKIFADNSVVISYSPRVKRGSRIWDENGEPEYEALASVMQKYERQRRAKLTEAQRKAEDDLAFEKATRAGVCTILVFDLKLILGEADQKLAKILG